MVTTGGLTAAELPRVLRIERASFSSPWDARDFRVALDDPRALFVGASEHGRLLGYAVAYVDEGELHLANLAVDPAHRRRGVGGRLLDEVLEFGRHRQCHGCTLEVRSRNRAAAAMYRRRGFLLTSVKRGYYQSPVDDALVMRIPLCTF